MMASSHVPFAATCWLAYCLGTDTKVTITQTLTAAFCGLLPDIDSPGSRIGRMFPYISNIVGAIMGHRGFSHSLIAAMLVAGGLVYYGMLHRPGGWLGIFMAPVLVGYLSHLIGDMCTVSGIPLMWPNKRKYTFPYTFKTNSVVEHCVVPPLCALAFFGYYQANGDSAGLSGAMNAIFTESGITHMIKGITQ